MKTQYRSDFGRAEKAQCPGGLLCGGHIVESAPDIVRRMAAEGHIVGNHTYHHPDMSAIADEAAFQKELDSLAALYRTPPAGAVPCFSIARRKANTARKT